MSKTIVIVGASLTGATAAITLRDEGFAGQIILIGAEPHPIRIKLIIRASQ